MATYIKTLKEDNGDITYPQTKAGAVLLTNGSDLETEMAKYVTAEDIASTSALTPPVQTSMIADGAVTAAKIDFTTINTLTASCGTSGSDAAIAANTIIQATAIYSQIGTGFSVSGGYIVVGAGISKILVSASVFYVARSGSNYGWFQLEKNNAEVPGARAITSIYGGSYGTATLAEKLISVVQGDKISIRNIDAATYRQLHSYITVRQVA